MLRDRIFIDNLRPRYHKFNLILFGQVLIRQQLLFQCQKYILGFRDYLVYEIVVSRFRELGLGPKRRLALEKLHLLFGFTHRLPLFNYYFEK